MKAHSRIVWDLCWSPDGALLATASRDATVKLWVAAEALSRGSTGGAATAAAAAAATLRFDDGVRSVAFAPGEDAPAEGSAGGTVQQGGGQAGAAAGSGARYILAVGLQSGHVHLLQLRCTAREAGSGVCEGGGGLAVESEVLWRSDATTQHAGAVRRVCWRRTGGGGGQGRGDGRKQYHLASCGEDHAVRVFAVSL
jgi:hypothetical protein